jgi:O-antigen/teichoic acid export membrane protein
LLPAFATMPLRSIARGAALNLAARCVTVALGLAILVVVARLGPDVQGAFALFASLESLLLTLFSGLGLLLAREVSHRQARPAALLKALMRAAFGLGAVAGVLLALVSMAAHAEPYRHLWLLALAAPFVLLVPTASGLWLGQGRMGPLNAPQVLAPLLVLALLLALGEGKGSDVASVLAAWVAGKALVGAATGWFALREAREPQARPVLLPAQLRFVAIIGLTNVISLLNYRATLFLLERWAGLAQAGVYSVALQVAELLWLLSSAVTISAYHRIGTPDAGAAAGTTLHAVRVNLLATLAAAPLLYAAATYLVPHVLGNDYGAALRPLALLLPGIAAYAAASSLSAYYTNHRGRPQWSAGIAGLSLALTLLIASWSIPAHGAAGAAVATSIAYACAIALALALFLRDTGLPWRALFGGVVVQRSRPA